MKAKPILTIMFAALPAAAQHFSPERGARESEHVPSQANPIFYPKNAAMEPADLMSPSGYDPAQETEAAPQVQYKRPAGFENPGRDVRSAQAPPAVPEIGPSGPAPGPNPGRACSPHCPTAGRGTAAGSPKAGAQARRAGSAPAALVASAAPGSHSGRACPPHCPALNRGAAPWTLQERGLAHFFLRDAPRNPSPPQVEPLNASALNSASAALKLAQERNRLRLYADAESAAQRTLELAPKETSAYEELAWAQLRQEKFASARSSAERAVLLDGRGAWARYLLAAAHEGIGEREALLKELAAASKLDPGRFEALLGRVQDGERLFASFEDDNLYILHHMSRAPRQRPRRHAASWPGILWGLLAAAGLWGFGQRLRRRRRALAASRRRLGPTPASSPASPEGELLVGKYKALRRLGRGGAGEVWQASDQTLGRPVAIKTLWPDPGGAQWATRELRLRQARTAARLHHAHIADVYEVVDQAAGLYLISEFVLGRSLRHIQMEEGRLPFSRTRAILVQACMALDYAHSLGVPHRSLSPSNIIISQQGHVKLIDFALSYPDADKERGYAAPEASGEDLSAASDVYSLGACAYHMLTGTHPLSPYRGSVVEGRRFPKASALATWLPAEMDALLERALSTRKEARQSVREFLEALERLSQNYSETSVSASSSKGSSGSGGGS